MSVFLCGSVDEQRISHEAIQQNSEWAKLADTAHEALWNLYQTIGKEHL